MKKTTFYFMAASLSIMFNPLQSKAEAVAIPTSAVTSTTTEITEARTLLTRLHNIHAMEKSKLNAAEKKTLRNEVLSIREQLERPGGGIYLSVGALIVIVILLIILL